MLNVQYAISTLKKFFETQKFISYKNGDFKREIWCPLEQKKHDFCITH